MQKKKMKDMFILINCLKPTRRDIVAAEVIPISRFEFAIPVFFHEDKSLSKAC